MDVNIEFESEHLFEGSRQINVKITSTGDSQMDTDLGITAEKPFMSGFTFPIDKSDADIKTEIKSKLTHQVETILKTAKSSLVGKTDTISVNA